MFVCVVICIGGEIFHENDWDWHHKAALDINKRNILSFLVEFPELSIPLYITLLRLSEIIKVGLHNKCLYSELFWSVFNPNARKSGQEYGHFLRRVEEWYTVDRNSYF